MKVLIFAYVCLGVIAAADQPFKALVDSALSFVKEGLQAYPKVELHLQLPVHQDLTKIQSWIREVIPGYVGDFLQDTIGRCENATLLKKTALEAMKELTRNGSANHEVGFETRRKRHLLDLIDSMLQEMTTGKGSIDFELDDISRTGLGDVYFYIKAQVSSHVLRLKDCPENCGLNHPLILKVLSILRSSEEDVTKKLVGVLLGLPGLETRFIRPQMLGLKSNINDLEEDDFDFLVSLGEWLNDVLQSGLIAMKIPFAEIRGKLIETLGSTKDEIVPELQNILAKLKDHSGSDLLLYNSFETVVKKYFGLF